MKNCAKSIVNHYQVNQTHMVSFLSMTSHKEQVLKMSQQILLYSRHSGYSTTKLQHSDPATIHMEGYKKTLKATLIYKNAESYCWVSNFENFTCVEQINLSLVSRYFLDQVVQPSVADLPYSSWLHNLQNENEPCYYGFSISLTIIVFIHVDPPPPPPKKNNNNTCIWNENVQSQHKWVFYSGSEETWSKNSWSRSELQP